MRLPRGQIDMTAIIKRCDKVIPAFRRPIGVVFRSRQSQFDSLKRSRWMFRSHVTFSIYNGNVNGAATGALTKVNPSRHENRSPLETPISQIVERFVGPREGINVCRCSHPRSSRNVEEFERITPGEIGDRYDFPLLPE